MKNRSLRLVTVLLLVAAMVLTMAACGNEPTPTPAPTATATPAPTATATPTPTPTATPTPTPSAPVVSDDETTLAEKYGITFVGADGVYGTMIKDTSNYANFGIKVDSAITGAKINGLTVEAGTTATDGKIVYSVVVKGVDTNGKSITSTFNTAGVATAAIPAGTYTVTYKFKVLRNASNFGLYKYEKVSESYEVEKTYTIAKKELEIKASTVATEIVDTVKYNVDWTVTSLTGKVGVSDAEAAAYKFAVDVTTVDETTVGAYPLVIVAKNAKGEILNRDEITLANYTLKFTDGVKYVYGAEDQAIVANALDVMVNAQIANVSSVQLAVSAYEGLTACQKLMLNADPNGPDAIQAVLEANYDLGRVNLITEVKALLKEVDKTVGTSAYTAAVDAVKAYIATLSTDAVAVGTKDDYDSDMAFASTHTASEFNASMGVANIATALSTAKTAAENNALEAFIKAAAASTIYSGATGTALNTANTTPKFEDAYKAKAKIEAGLEAYGKLTTAQKSTYAEFKTNADLWLGYVAIYAQYLKVLENDLTAYTAEVVTKDEVEALLGYTFGAEGGAITYTTNNSAYAYVAADASAATASYILAIAKAPANDWDGILEVYTARLNNWVALKAAIATAAGEMVNYVLDTFGTDGYKLYVAEIGGESTKQLIETDIAAITGTIDWTTLSKYTEEEVIDKAVAAAVKTAKTNLGTAVDIAAVNAGVAVSNTATSAIFVSIQGAAETKVATGATVVAASTYTSVVVRNVKSVKTTEVRPAYIALAAGADAITVSGANLAVVSANGTDAYSTVEVTAVGKAVVVKLLDTATVFTVKANGVALTNAAGTYSGNLLTDVADGDEVTIVISLDGYPTRTIVVTVVDAA